jgi:hypothetical protein
MTATVLGDINSGVLLVIIALAAGRALQLGLRLTPQAGKPPHDLTDSGVIARLLLSRMSAGRARAVLFATGTTLWLVVAAVIASWSAM